mgnify:CR=1 FL=1
MDYVQLTMDDWLSMKEQLKRDLNGVAESFVRIGYTLRKIEEQQLYQKDGYETIADFARKEYGLSPSTVSRFMAINAKYSIDGYSECLRPEFAGIGSSKLAEMLTLPDGDLEMIRPGTTRETIRELKQFNAQEPGESGDLQELIQSFFQDNPGKLKNLYASEAFATGDVEEMVEQINPSGNLSYRKGIYFLMMYGPSEGLKIKKFGQPKPEDMSWADFFFQTREIFGEELPEEEPQIPGQMAIPDDYPETAPVAPAQNPETRINPRSEPDHEDIADRQQEAGKTQELQTENSDIQTKADTVFTGEIQNEESEVAPAQENPHEMPETRINTRCERDEGQQDIAEAMNPPEVQAEQYMTRKDYLDTLTAYGTAEYIYKNLRPEILNSQTALEYWLLKEVDVEGREEDEE